MKYPYVESSQSSWAFETLYYDVKSEYFSEIKPTEARADVDDDRLAYSDVLREITEIGGDPEDIADAGLYWVAQQVAWDMRLSTTPKVLDRIGEVWGLQSGEEFARFLRDRAETILVGAALVGTLRAIAWHLTKTYPHPYRWELIRSARIEYDRCELVSGKADLIADDAFAHLRTAEHLKPGHEDFRTGLMQRGTLLFGAAHAQAMRDGWNPFTLHRLHTIMTEYGEIIAEVSDLRRDIGDTVTQVVAETNNYYADSTSRFREETHRLDGDDIGSFFACRPDCPGIMPLDSLSEPALILLDLDLSMARLV